MQTGRTDNFAFSDLLLSPAASLVTVSPMGLVVRFIMQDVIAMVDSLRNRNRSSRRLDGLDSPWDTGQSQCAPG